MTDRHRTVHVTLERDTRDDDLEELLRCFRRMRGVEAAEPGPVVDFERRSARREARFELREELKRVLWPEVFDAD